MNFIILLLVFSSIVSAISLSSLNFIITFSPKNSLCFFISSSIIFFAFISFVTNFIQTFLGITFTLLPPSIYAIFVSFNLLIISIPSFIGFPLLSSPMFPPECPPLKLSYIISNPASLFLLVVYFIFPFHSLHSAELTNIFPSFPLSSEIILLLSILFKSKFIAPFIVVSSSEVNIHSILGVSIFLQSSTASIIATPMPLSAPRVVSLAFIKSSSTYKFNLSLEKSCLLPTVFSHIMSV